MLKIFWILVFAYSAGLASPTVPYKTVIVLAGQSNMSGRGGIANGTWNGIVPPQCRPSSAISRLNAELKWVEAAEPLHRDIDINATCGIGPSMAFAHKILDQISTIKAVGLVPCAVGGFEGTKISEWARGTFLYNNLVRRAQAATKGGEKIRAMLWYQGESDTVNLEDVLLYKRRLKRFFLDLRKDLKSPILPIIQVALASGQGPYIEKVREVQLGLKLTNIRCVDAKGLEMEPDHLHLSTTGEIQLGKMLADAYIKTKT